MKIAEYARKYYIKGHQNRNASTKLHIGEIV